ncbi:unnamed protein product [Hermetia illucens]|uniref:Peptidase S1 domain-containing protein n=1 Tax=Hermetia illucens TaxID=343691 RepID=A0A7R8UPV8_HERIL|nr:serine protease snake-like isoform X2 [Hermetia illucens]CAD7084463.1 unnamed protein product [Hermetia illucens]
MNFVLGLGVWMSVLVAGFATVNVQILKSISEEKCEHYYSSGNKENDKPDGSRFPYMAAVGWSNENGTISYRCGGILIDPKYVIGLAHCILRKQPSHILLGSQELPLSATLDNGIPIKNISVHPGYEKGGVYHDILIYELENEVRNRPACLWNRDSIPDSEIFSLLYSVDEKNAKLLRIQNQLYPNDQCLDFYGKYARLSMGIMESQLCAAELNHTSCQLPSVRGPLIMQEQQPGSLIPYVIGTASFGMPCGRDSMPTVYTKISAYTNWIESNIWA